MMSDILGFVTKMGQANMSVGIIPMQSPAGLVYSKAHEHVKEALEAAKFQVFTDEKAQKARHTEPGLHEITIVISEYDSFGDIRVVISGMNLTNKIYYIIC